MHMHCFVFIYFCVQLVHYVLVVIMQGVACTPQDARAEEPQTTDWFAKTRQSDIGHMYFCKRCAETIEKRKEEKKVDVSAPAQPNEQGGPFGELWYPPSKKRV